MGKAWPRLRIYLLGAPRVEWDGQNVPIPRRNVRGLLYRLAADSTPLSRGQLCLLFWPDEPEATSRRNLTHLLTHLRGALPEADLLLTEGEAVGLNPQVVWCDVRAFRHLLRDGTKKIEQLRMAVDWVGGPFLTGFSLPNCAEFEQWALLEQNALERLYLDALQSLIDQEIARQEYEQARRDALRYLETDDLAEDIHRRLIVLYAVTGQRQAALQQYERCVTVLERELGVNPLPETRAVYQAVMEGKLPRLAEPAPRDSAATPGSGQEELPLVGREPAWRALEAALDRARRGEGNVVLISGEAGIGKSRLIQDFLARCRAEARIFFSSGYARESMIPYRPLVDALRAGEMLQSSSFDLAPVWLAEAARLFPELRSRFPDLPPPLPSNLEEAHLRLFDALSRLIRTLASAPQVTVLCIDDLQWADRTTLDWLAYFCRQIPGKACRLLIIGSYRDDEAESIADLCRALRGLGIAAEIDLTGLDELAIGDLVRQAFARLGMNEALIRLLKHATGGNPLFLKELLNALVESSEGSSLEKLPLPKGLKEAVAGRLRQLDAATRQVVEAGAVLGSTLSFDSICLTAGRSELETLDSLERLCVRHILFEDQAHYHFTHDLFRQAVYAGLSPVRRQLLHRRAGRTLEKLEPDAAGVLAYHFEMGGEYQEALRSYGQAAQKAQALFAWQEAEFHESQRLDLVGQIDPRGEDRELIRLRGTILAERAHIRYLQNRIAERDADLNALANLAEASGDEQMHLVALTGQVISLNHSGRNAEAVVAAEKGLILAERLDDKAARLSFLSQLGLAHYLMGQPRAALAALEPALTLSEQENNLEMRGDVSQFLGHVHFHLGNFAKALAYHQESLECSLRMGDQTGPTWCTLNVGFLYLKMGSWDQSKEHLTQGLAFARQSDNTIAAAFALTLLGQWELYRGSYLAAIALFRQALPIHEAAQAEHNIAATEEPLGMAYYQLGDLSQARAWLERVVARVRSIGYRRLLATVLVDLGLVEIASQRLEAGRGFLEEVVAISRASECRENLAKGLAALARLERQAGRLELAQDHAQEAIQVAQASLLPACQMWGEMEAGLAYLASGGLAAALACTGRAVSLLPQAHEAWIGTEHVHEAQAQCLRAVGQEERAVEHERLARAIIQAKAKKISDPGQREQFLAGRSIARESPG